MGWKIERDEKWFVGASWWLEDIVVFVAPLFHAFDSLFGFFHTTSSEFNKGQIEANSQLLLLSSSLLT